MVSASTHSFRLFSTYQDCSTLPVHVSRFRLPLLSHTRHSYRRLSPDQNALQYPTYIHSVVVLRRLSMYITYTPMHVTITHLPTVSAIGVLPSTAIVVLIIDELCHSHASATWPTRNIPVPYLRHIQSHWQAMVANESAVTTMVKSTVPTR